MHGKHFMQKVVWKKKNATFSTSPQKMEKQSYVQIHPIKIKFNRVWLHVLIYFFVFRPFFMRFPQILSVPRF